MVVLDWCAARKARAQRAKTIICGSLVRVANRDEHPHLTRNSITLHSNICTIQYNPPCSFFDHLDAKQGGQVQTVGRVYRPLVWKISSCEHGLDSEYSERFSKDTASSDTRLRKRGPEAPMLG